jgi:hypothetical protein
MSARNPVTVRKTTSVVMPTGFPSNTATSTVVEGAAIISFNASMVSGGASLAS